MSYIVLGMDIADAVQAVVVIWCKEGNQNGKLTSGSWADRSNWRALTDFTWANAWQLSWQITAKLTIHSQPDNTQMSGQKTNVDTDDNWGRILQQVAAELTAEQTSCSWADSLYLSQHTAVELTDSSWDENAQLCDADTKQLGWADILHLS